MSLRAEISSKGSDHISHSPEETILLGKKFASSLKSDSVTGLFGNLGSGKTQFVKGICEYFKVKDKVNSPTFTIVNEYSGVNNEGQDIRINHFDLFRLKNASDLKEIGIESYTGVNSICLIEWAELADQYLRGSLLKVYFDFGVHENERVISIIE